MNNELKEKLVQLKELRELIVKKEEYSKLMVSKEEYISYYLKKKKPKLKKKKDVSVPQKEHYKVILLLIIGIVSLVIGACFLIGGDEGVGIFLMISGGFFVPLSVVCYSILKDRYKVAIVSYYKIIESNKEAENYNSKIYPKELEEYNLKLAECEKRYAEQVEETEPKYKEVCAEIEKLSDVLYPKYYGDIDGIIEYIESGRADSFKEALNGYIQEKNDIAYKQAQLDLQAEKLDAEISHNYEMQRAAQAQADAAREQAELMKEEAEKRRSAGRIMCAGCANYPCGGDPAYCGSFVKRT